MSVRLPRRVICASASMVSSVPSALMEMRLSSSMPLLSLPVRCRRSKPAWSLTSTPVVPHAAKGVVVSTVIRSSPLPPSRRMLLTGRVLPSSSSVTKSTEAFRNSCAKLKSRPPLTLSLSSPSPPSILTPAAPRSTAKPNSYRALPWGSVLPRRDMITSLVSMSLMLPTSSPSPSRTSTPTVAGAPRSPLIPSIRILFKESM